jgi:hypothetical protein
MALKTIFLMGAPLPSSLDWENDELLNSPVQPFSGTDTIPMHDISIVQSGDPIKWRVLQPLLTEHPAGYSEYYHGPEDPSFLTTHQLVEADNESMNEDSILSEFYDHSFVVHETSEISTTGLRDEESTQESEPALSCTDAAATGAAADLNDYELTRSLQISGPIRDLQHLPTARYLQSIAPQTMTVNLIVGILAIHPPRRVVTRQWKTELDIIELIVGDETRTGFGVNIWLPASTSISCKTQDADRLSRSLAILLPRDIILLRTIGLSSFRDQVYGQSLRGGMTKVDLLYRQPVDVTDTVGFYKSGLRRDSPHDHADLPLQKTRRVREWIFQFVGATDEAGGGPSRMSQTQRGHQRLPPDTQ